MNKLSLLRDRLFLPNKNLTAIMNKARVFNTSLAICELSSVLFFLIIPGRTNQQMLVFLYSLNCVVAVVGEMQIQIKNTIDAYRNALIFNLLC